MKSTVIIISALLLGCAAKEPKPAKQMNLAEAIYTALDIKIDPKEKNPLFYELAGRWRSNGTAENCETLWTEVSISQDKKIMTLSLIEKTSDEKTVTKESYSFNILQPTRNSMKLQDQQSSDLHWELSKPNLWTFSLKPANDDTLASNAIRCTKPGASFTVGEPVHIENIDLSEALKKANQKQ